MSFTYGSRPESVLTDSKGNVLSGLTLTFYASKADAQAQLDPLGSATVTGGLWSFTHPTLSDVWTRTNDGRVWPVKADESTVAAIDGYLVDSFAAGVPSAKSGGLQATVDAEAARGTGALTAGRAIRLPSGTLSVTSTIELNQQSAMLLGHGSGTTLRWDGPSGQPMIHVVDTTRVVLRDLTLVAGTNAPSDFIFFDRPSVPSVGTNELMVVERVRIGRKMTNQAAVTALNTATVGIHIGGALTGDNDQWYLRNVVIDDCTTGLKIDNEQSVWGSLTDVFFNACGTGIDTRSSFTATNLTFNRSSVCDLKLDRCRVVVTGFYSEHTAMLWNQLGGSALSIRGGNCIVGTELSDASYWATSTVSGAAGGATGTLVLDAFSVINITTSRSLFITGSSSNTDVATVDIRGCNLPSGDSDAGYVINGYAAGTPLSVRISQGSYFRDQVVQSLAAAGRVVPREGRFNLPPFYKDTIGASATVSLPFSASTTTALPMTRAGWITSLTLISNQNVSAGTLTATILKNGSAQAVSNVTIPVGSFRGTTTIPIGSLPFTATSTSGDTIGVRVTTDASFTPTASNLVAIVEVTTS